MHHNAVHGGKGYFYRPKTENFIVKELDNKLTVYCTLPLVGQDKSKSFKVWKQTELLPCVVGMKDMVYTLITEGMWHRSNWGTMDVYTEALKTSAYELCYQTKSTNAFILLTDVEHFIMGVVIYWDNMMQFFVHPDYRKNGIAKLLVKNLIELRPDLNIENIRWGIGVKGSEVAVPKMIKYAKLLKKKSQPTNSSVDVSKIV